MRFFLCFLLSVAGFASEAAKRRRPLLKAPKVLQRGAAPAESVPIRFPFALTPDRVREIFSDPEAIAQYRGQKGYLLFALKSPNNIAGMAYIYNMVSVALGPDRFKLLGWQKFYGDTEEFRSLPDKILDSEGNVLKEYIGMEGQALFADRYYKGDMHKTFVNVSAVLPKNKLWQLGRRLFLGKTEEFHSLPDKILDSEGNVRKEYLGREGQIRFADMHYKGNMHKTYQNVSAVLGGKDAMKALGLEEWKAFAGDTKEFRALRGKILDSEGNVRKEFRGQDGQALFADRYYKGDMHKTFVNVSAVLTEREFTQTDWQGFKGGTEEFRALRGKILDSEGNVREEYRGQEGQKLFADRHYSGDMKKTFGNVSAVLTESEFRQTGWQGFKGKTEEFRSLPGKILDSEGNVWKEFRGQDGQALFADKYFMGDMQKTYQHVSAVLTKSKFRQAGWKSFQGDTKEFRALPGKILDSEGNVRKEYIGMEGQALFADRYYKGNMNKTFANVSAVLTKREFTQTGWQGFNGGTEEFRALRGKILDSEGNVRKEFRGQEGQIRFADMHYNSNMNKAYGNVSAVLGGKDAMKALGLEEWTVFKGGTEEFRALRGKILDSEGNVRKEYLGRGGQIRFADRYYKGNMNKTYQNVSAVLGGKDAMKALGLEEWKGIQIFTGPYHELIRLFQEAAASYASAAAGGFSDGTAFYGDKGQEEIAERFFQGNKKAAYVNVSMIRETLFGCREAFNALKWRRGK